MAGYDKAEMRNDTFVATHRIVDEETYLASLERNEVNDPHESHDLKSKKNTYRPR